MEENRENIARKIIETTNCHLFLTGKAGTGKTTFLRRLKNDSSKRMIVLAPTGIAAINAGGMTIHSFFQLPFTPFIPESNFNHDNFYKINKQKVKLIRSLDLLVIDEISMVRSDLLDAVDYVLRKIRKNDISFGGLQLLMIGDIQQLPPVVTEPTWNILKKYYKTPYFFDSKSLERTEYLTIELSKIYRQTDKKFIHILNCIREGNPTNKIISTLNERYIPDYNLADESDGYIQIMTHNYQVNAINETKLAGIDSESYSFQAKITGNFPESSYPTNLVLTLKHNAQIMFIKNDPNKRYYNGMLGTIRELNEKNIVVSPKDNPSVLIELKPEEWTNVHYGLDKNTSEIKEIIDGTFTQFPVKLAWAITIHKSQGLTFDKIYLDSSKSFSYGQVYVALSRCRTLNGIILKKPINRSSIIFNKQIEDFVHKKHIESLQCEDITSFQKDYILHLLSDLFDFSQEKLLFSLIIGILNQNLYDTFPNIVKHYKQEFETFNVGVIGISNKFHEQYKKLLYSCEEITPTDFLQERIKKGGMYFIEKLSSVSDSISELNIPIDNSDVKKKLESSVSNIRKQILFHIRLLKYFVDHQFSISSYLKHKNKLIVESDKITEQEVVNKKETDILVEEIPPTNKILYEVLQEWKVNTAKDFGVPAYNILKNSSIIAISKIVPTTNKALSQIPNIGKKTLSKYGNEILGIVNKFVEGHPDTEINRNIKSSKLTTREISLNFYTKGLTILEIANKRNLSINTVIGHLSSFIKSGYVHLEDLMNIEHYHLIKEYLLKHSGSEHKTLTSLKNELSDQGIDVSYTDIRLTLDNLNT